MGFGNRGGSGKKGSDEYGPSRLFGSAWEVDSKNVVASGTLSLDNLKQVLKDYPNEIDNTKDYGKQIRFMLARPKDGKKKSSSPDFYVFLAVDTRDAAGETTEAREDEDVPF